MIWKRKNALFDSNKYINLIYFSDGECSPILCLANHPNQQHLIASGNLNGLIFIYDVRSQKKPLIMCHNHSQPSKIQLTSKLNFFLLEWIFFSKLSRFASIHFHVTIYFRVHLTVPYGSGIYPIKVIKIFEQNIKQF